MTTIGISLPEHRIRLPLQTLGDAPQRLDPNDTDISGYRMQAQRVFDLGGRMTQDDVSAIVAQLFLEK